ncbi:hypothetical protein ACOSQ3_031991 [Xanthoceras sorbifolium]
MELHPSSASIAQKGVSSIIWPMMERRSIQECYFDPQFDSFALPDLGDLFDDDHLKGRGGGKRRGFVEVEEGSSSV